MSACCRADEGATCGSVREAHFVDSGDRRPYMRALSNAPAERASAAPKDEAMKVRSSLKSLKNRHRDCKLVRRKGRLYVINKTDPRFKARQG